MLDARLLSFPDAYTSHLSETEFDKKSEELREKIESFISETNPEIPPFLLYKLSFFPKIAEIILTQIPTSNNAFGIIASSNPYSAFRILVSNYEENIGEKLEILLLCHPESVLKLLEWSFASKTPLRYAEDIYLRAIMQDFTCAWAYFRKFRNGNADEFLKNIRKIHCRDNPMSPQGAFYKLCFEKRPLSEPMLNLLKLEPKIALLTTILFDECPRYILDAWAPYPNWAYHILINIEDLSNDISQNCLQSLIRALPWMYQYLHDIRQKERSEPAYNKLMATAVAKWKD